MPHDAAGAPLNIDSLPTVVYVASMPRHSMTASLTPLSTRFPAFSGFAPAENKTERIAAMLRTVATAGHSSHARPFYSLRETARFFGVSVPTVSAAYRVLEADGLLARKRGAMTFVPARFRQPRVAIRGVVGAPVWTPGFLDYPEWRIFLRRLDEALRQHRFVTDLIFYRLGEETTPEFADRVLDHSPDLLVWFRPPRIEWAAVQIIADHGIPLVAVGEFPAKWATLQYFVDRQPALARALRAWRAAGIRTVFVPARSSEPTPLAACQITPPAGLKAQCIPFDHARSPTGVLRQLMRSKRSGVLFVDDFVFRHFCRACPQAMANLLQRTRVATLHMATLDPSLLGGARIDYIRTNWAAVAARIADDIATERTAPTDSPIRIVSEWCPQIPATQLAAHYGVE